MTAEQIWEVLARTCGAEAMKEDFIYHASKALQSGEKLEYRFQGALGFGGKVYINYDPKPRVSCYPEDETVQRKWMAIEANEQLSRMA